MAEQRVLTESLLNRENHFDVFVAETLKPFWQRREEWRFNGVDNIPIQCVRFTSPEHTKALVIISGFLESYVKYQELIYDFFQAGYDVFMLDHRGQGFSGRILQTRYQVYVERFSDYIDDLDAFWQDNIASAHYQQRYLIGHSMGGAITALFLARRPDAVNAVVFSAPMAGIKLPMPLWCANLLINTTQRWDYLRKSCVIKRKTPLPFKLNLSCNSAPRYQHLLDVYHEYPEIQLHGPTYHWVKEAMEAGKEVIASARLITTPLLLMQAGKEHLVDNNAQNEFIDALRQAGHLRPGEGFIRYDEAAHEILFDHDAIRVAALTQVLRFFEQHQ